MFFNKYFSSRKEKQEKSSYLKYEEGEVIPVEPKNPNYPPFLEEDNEVKSFKDIQNNKENEHQSFLQNMKDKGANEQTDMSTSFNSADNNQKKSKLRKFHYSLLMKLVWLFIIGGLVYYSIPMLKHFSTETPQIGLIEDLTDESKDSSDLDSSISDIKDTIVDTSKQVGEIAGNMKEGIEETVQQGKAIINQEKEKVETNNSKTTTIQMTEDGWLSFITSIQNEKQKKLIEIQQYTTDLAYGNIRQSNYRLKMKGINKDIDNLLQQVERTTNGQNLSDVEQVIGLLLEELKHMQKMSVGLSSLSTADVVPFFNQEILVQNELTEQYKETFKSLLDKYDRSYKEENGMIVY